METTNFDSTLGGSEQLPYLANNLKFAASRSVEIAALTECILRPSKTKLIFQSLPVHMRRRVMSHNVKRLPRKLRQGHLEQLKKSGLPPKQKRPSRKYRRRPTNLLEEYNRRQRNNVWLETHIWHAKRFHMIERWGHRLAYSPCDKAFRACYRATSAHCLLQDISYYTPVQISGPIGMIQQMFNSITNPSCGLSIGARAYLSGNREGVIDIYEPNSFPFGYIGKIQFIWVPNDGESMLWLFIHPSQLKQVEGVLLGLLCTNKKDDDFEITAKRRKVTNNYSDNIKVKVLPGIFNRFRLTGPLSHAVLAKSLICVDDIETINTNNWVKLFKNSDLHICEKNTYWKNIASANSPSQLPSRMILGLIVRDPRFSRPTYRAKAKCETDNNVQLDILLKIPPIASSSPIWDRNIHDSIKNNMVKNATFIEHVTKTQLIPGAINLYDPKFQSIPVVLVQRPGSQDPHFKKIGYGSGWDIIIPSGYGLQFWLTFIMFGARSGGLRETESLSFEMGECYLPPDSDAGHTEEKRIESELREKYFRLPPSKRVNYIKLAVNTPFICPWKLLLKDWSGENMNNFFVLRDKQTISQIQDCLNKKRQLPYIHKASQCLIAVYLHTSTKGKLNKYSLICLPQTCDIQSIKSLFEQHHEDPNEKLRKQKRVEHIKYLKHLRRKQIKLKKKHVTADKKHTPKAVKTEPSEYVKMMRNLWIPPDVKSVRNSCSRQVMGWATQGAFSFTEARSCAIGYIAYNAINTLITNGLNQVLIRNTTSRKYRLAKIQLIKNL